MRTLSYLRGQIEEIKVGENYYFGQLVAGDEDLEELLKSGCVAVYDEEIEDERIVDFEIVEKEENILETFVKVTDIR